MQEGRTVLVTAVTGIASLNLKDANCMTVHKCTGKPFLTKIFLYEIN